MRSTVAACALLALLIGTAGAEQWPTLAPSKPDEQSALPVGTAGAEQCRPGALGVNRTLVVDPSEHARVGSMQYGESLPLNDHEVVLTFDDGPLPAYTSRILETLASECVKATFFMVGRMARAYPAMVRRVHDEGHTVANHSQNHPFTFHKMSVDHASREIEEGFASLREALGDPAAVAPFFRIPGLLRQNSVEQYLAAHGDMTWSVDFLADDWIRRVNNREVARRAISRIEARGKGILLLHDIQPRTALALPDILKELKARGYKIVHVVPATADRPKTATAPEQWVARRTPEQQIWAPMPVVGMETPEEASLPAPSPVSFGIERFGSTVKIALAQTLERHVTDPPPPAWPSPTAYAVAEQANALPVPAAYNFKYSRPFRSAPAPERPKLVSAKKHRITARAKSRGPFLGALFGSQPRSRTRPIGHQLTVVRPSSQVR